MCFFEVPRSYPQKVLINYRKFIGFIKGFNLTV